MLTRILNAGAGEGLRWWAGGRREAQARGGGGRNKGTGKQGTKQGRKWAVGYAEWAIGYAYRVCRARYPISFRIRNEMFREGAGAEQAAAKREVMAAGGWAWISGPGWAAER